jgi:hypothetical protein
MAERLAEQPEQMVQAMGATGARPFGTSLSQSLEVRCLGSGIDSDWRVHSYHSVLFPKWS